MTENEETRQCLFNKIQLLCAGEDADVVLAALQDTLGAVVGFMAVNDADAAELIEDTARQLHASVELNWDATREMRSQCPQFTKSHQ